MIAAVLHLHIGAGARAEPVDQVAGGFTHRHDVIDHDALCLSNQIRGQAGPCRGLHFFCIADHAGHFGHGGEGFWFGLCRTACHDNGRIRVVAAQAADFLTRLAHGF